jgi:hypothetical protein
MLLATLLLLAGAPATTPPAPKDSDRAECLKQCAGAPKDATGQKLLACLNRCEVPTDAGVPAR